MSKLVFAAVASLLAANVALAQAVAEKGGVMTDASGRSLYTFDKDTAGKSNCNGGCASTWPPFAAADADKASGKFSIVTRDDGAKQWALDGKPLYFFSSDSAPGDVKGDGRGGVWHAVRSGAKPAAAAREVQRPSTSY